MSAPIFPQETAKNLHSSPKVLESRNQYRPCHISLLGDEHRSAAILVDSKYYGLVKVVKESQRALEICNRLSAKGTDAVITLIAKGYAIWLHEPDARPAPPMGSQSSSSNKRMNAPACTVLDPYIQPRVCQIRVPDLAEPLRAIVIDGKYYGLFKVAEARSQALELAAKLGLRGDETVITKTDEGNAVWVFEPDAVLV